MWRDLKRFRTAENNENKNGKLCIVRVFKTIWNCRKKPGNNVGKLCIVTVFETISNFYVKTSGCSPLTPIDLHFILQFWVKKKFDFLLGLQVATPVQLCYFFYANIILNMLNSTFLFETCCNKVCVYSK